MPWLSRWMGRSSLGAKETTANWGTSAECEFLSSRFSQSRIPEPNFNCHLPECVLHDCTEHFMIETYKS